MVKHGLFLTVVLATLMSATPLFANELAWYDGQWPEEKSDLTLAPHVHTGRLANGFRWIYVPHTGAKKRLTLSLNVQAGSLMESPDELGAAHLVSHLAFRGSKDFPPSRLEAFFKSQGLSLGSDANVQTRPEATIYTLTLTSTQRRVLDEGLGVLRSVADGLTFLPDAVDKERDAMHSERLLRASDAQDAYQSWKAFLYGDSRFGQSNLGTEATLTALMPASLQAFYQTWYVPSRMVLVVVGEANVPHLSQLIESHFGSLLAKDPPVITSFGAIDRFGTKILVQPRAVTQAVLSLMILTEPHHKADSVTLRRRAFVNTLIQLALQRRLTQRGEQTPDLWSRVVFMNNAAEDFTPYVAFQAALDGKRWKDVLRAFAEELLRARDFGLTADELKVAVHELERALAWKVKATSRESCDKVASDVVDAINEDRVYIGSKAELVLFRELKNVITLDEVNAALRDILSPTNRRIRLDGDVAVSDVDVREYWESLEKLTVLPQASSAEISFPYLTLPEPRGDVPQLTSRRIALSHMRDLELWEGTMANGTRLVLLPRIDHTDRLEVDYLFGDGLQGVKDADALTARVAVMALQENGIGRLNATESAQQFEDRELSVREYLAETTNGIHGEANRNDEELLLEAVWTQFMDPTITQDNVKRLADKVTLTASEHDKTVRGYVESRRDAFFMGERVRMRPIRAGEINAMPLSRLKNYLTAARDRGERLLLISGAFNRHKVLMLANRLFGALPTTEEARVGQGARGVFPAGADRRVVQADDHQDVAVYSQAWHADLSSVTDHVTLVRRMLVAKLLEARLRRAVDGVVEQGESASVDYRIMDAHGFGYWTLSVSSTTGQLEAVKAAVERLLTVVQEKGFTEEERQQQVNALQTTYRTLSEHTASWHQVAREAWMGKGRTLDDFANMPTYFEDTTLEALNAEVRGLMSSPTARLTVLSQPKVKAEPTSTSAP